MVSAVTIKSVRDGVKLTFSDPEYGKFNDSVGPDYFVVSASGPSFSGTTRVYGYMSEDLPRLFEFISENWRGWEGEKQWSSLEGEFSLTASSDKLGHIRLVFCLSPNVLEYGWKLKGEIELEAGGLERLAKEVKSFWEGESHSNPALKSDLGDAARLSAP